MPIACELTRLYNDNIKSKNYSLLIQTTTQHTLHFLPSGGVGKLFSAYGGKWHVDLYVYPWLQGTHTAGLWIRMCRPIRVGFCVDREANKVTSRLNKDEQYE